MFVFVRPPVWCDGGGGIDHWVVASALAPGPQLWLLVSPSRVTRVQASKASALAEGPHRRDGARLERGRRPEAAAVDNRRRTGPLAPVPGGLDGVWSASSVMVTIAGSHGGAGDSESYLGTSQ